jgi:hypothetical protein
MAEGAKLIRERHDTAEQDLAAFSTQQGQLMSKLETESRETAKAWKWIQDHLDEFEAEVYPPPLMSCSIKDSRYVNAVESMLNKYDFLAITAQNLNDMKKLSNQIHEVMGLSDVTLRTSDSVVPAGRLCSQTDLKSFGMDGWAIDFVDGPKVVLAMLCGSANLHRCAVTLQNTTEGQYDSIIGDGRLRRWVTNSHTYTIVSRAEYGGVSTVNTKLIKPARYWVDQPVDSSAQNEIQSRIEAAKAEYESAMREATPLQKIIKDLKSKIPDLEREVVSQWHRSFLTAC